MTKKDAGSLGGLATVRKYGSSYMRQIGARGAKTLWQRYKLLPYRTGQYQLVNRISGKVKAIR